MRSPSAMGKAARVWMLTLALLALPLAPRPWAQETPRLVCDINQTTNTISGGMMAPMVALGDAILFVASNQANGRELWRYDFASGASTMLRDIWPGKGNGVFSTAFFEIFNGKLIFSGFDGVHGNELWVSDGTANGTRRLLASGPIGGLAIPEFSVPVKTRDGLYFWASDGVHGVELWKTDGTAAGTVMVKDFTVGAGDSVQAYSKLAAIGDTVYFCTKPGAQSTLWKTDGTAAGSVALLTPLQNNEFTGLTPVGSTLFFYKTVAIGVELWKSNGTPAGTVFVAGPFPSAVTFFNVDYKGMLVFAIRDDAHGYELWKSDGTTSGTALIKDVRPGAEPAGRTDYMQKGPLRPMICNDTLFFAHNDGVHNYELWKTDGTEAGTEMVRDIRPSELESPASDYHQFPEMMGVVNNRLLFLADDGAGAALWKTDGTTSGTLKLMAAWFASSWVLPIGNNLYFGTNSWGLWKTDGSTSGTVRVGLPPAPAVSNSSPGPITTAGNKAYFAATTGEAGIELWSSDETTSGARLVNDLTPGKEDASPSCLTELNGKVYFLTRAYNQTYGYRYALRCSDGTSAGTTLIRYIQGPAGQPIKYSVTPKLVRAGQTLYFYAWEPDTGMELWKSDGTPAGTSLVKDIYPGSTDSLIADLTPVGDMVYFTAQSKTNSVELWKSDGTAAGTVQVISLGTYSYPSRLTAFNGKLAFIQSDALHDVELWISDGTASGTKMVKDTAPGASTGFVSSDARQPMLLSLNGSLYALGVNTLWKSDGTENGTVPLLPSQVQVKSGLAALEGQLYFVADDGVHGSELWCSNGLPGGTHMVADLAPGPESSMPANLAALGRWLIFSAYDPQHGVEVWKTDGSQYNTRLLGDVAPGPASSNPSNFALLGDTLLFSADGNAPGQGYELWALNLAPKNPVRAWRLYEP